MKYPSLTLMLLLLSGMAHAASGDMIIKSRKPGGDIVFKAKDSGGTERELLRADADTNTVTVKKLITSTIHEYTPGNGVVIGGVTFKDGSISNVLIDPKALTAGAIVDLFDGTHSVGNQRGLSFLSSRYPVGSRPIVAANVNCTQPNFGRTFIADIDAFITVDVGGSLSSNFKITRTRVSQKCNSGGFSGSGADTYDDVESSGITYDVTFNHDLAGVTSYFGYSPYFVFFSVRVLGVTEFAGSIQPVPTHFQ